MHKNAGVFMPATTSIDQARAQQQTYSTSAIADGGSHGRKRSSEQAISPGTSRISHRPRHGLPSSLRPPRLHPGAIKVVEEAQVKSTSIPKTNEAVPEPSQNPLLDLSHPRYGLPEGLTNNLNQLGVHSVYPWQSACLLGRGLLEGNKNLVYSAPTGGGKSLVADVLMLKQIIENPTKKAIIVLPFVALVQEKVRWIRRVVEGVAKSLLAKHELDSHPRWKRPHTASIRVAGFFGGRKTRTAWQDLDIAICTIEKVGHICPFLLTVGQRHR